MYGYNFTYKSCFKHSIFNNFIHPLSLETSEIGEKNFTYSDS